MTISIEREVDGRWLAAVVGCPGVMAYGVTRLAAVAAVLDLLDAMESRGEP